MIWLSPEHGPRPALSLCFKYYLQSVGRQQVHVNLSVMIDSVNAVYDVMYFLLVCTVTISLQPATVWWHNPNGFKSICMCVRVYGMVTV